MIGKAKSIGHTGGSIGYALKKDQAEILDKRFLVSETPEGICREMATFQNLNGNCKNNTISFVLSPDKADNLSNAELKSIANDFLQKMGLENNQSFIVKHVDNKNKIPHLHIYTNRIDFEGNAYNDSFIGKKASEMADKIALERNLTRARSVELQNIQARKPVKEQVRGIFEDALKQSKDYKEFFENVKNKGVKLTQSIDKSGKVTGYRVQFKDLNLKASEIGNKFTFAKLPKALSMAKSILKPTSLLTDIAAKTIKKGLDIGGR